MNRLPAWFRPVNVRYEWWEEWVMRLAFAALLVRGMPEVTHFTGQPVPNGLAHWMDFTFLSDPAVVLWLRWIYGAMIGLYVLGIWRMLSLPVLAAVLVSYGTLGNSQGAINHITQIFVLVVLGQVVSAWHSGLWLRRRITDKSEYRRQANDNLIHATLQVMAAVYVVSGLTKLINSGGEWIWSVPNLAVQFAKNLDMAYYNTLQTPEGGTVAVIAWIAEWPNAARLLFGTGLVLELFAFLALLRREWAALMGLSLLLMHATISHIMHLGFFYNKILLLVFFINIPFWIVCVARRIANRQESGTRRPAIAPESGAL